jgi:stearoyl-CoA desaturase (Delta-9 desaturase)
MRTKTSITLPASIRSCGDFAPLLGAGVALVLVALHGRPLHAMASFWAMSLATGLGVTIGFHRLFAHRSFITTRWAECLFMILGCMAGMGSPFAWIANHRIHHRHSDQEGDPRSYRIRGRGFLGVLAGGWELYLVWLRDSKETYSPSIIKDLASRPDLTWIDRHWFKFFLLGLAIPAGVGFLIGETAYDALIGFAWGGLFRHFGISSPTPSTINGAAGITRLATTAATICSSASSRSERAGTTIITRSHTLHAMAFTGGSPTSAGA